MFNIRLSSSCVALAQQLLIACDRHTLVFPHSFYGLDHPPASAVNAEDGRVNGDNGKAKKQKVSGCGRDAGGSHSRISI